MKTAIAILVVLVMTLAYFRITDTKDVQKEIDRNPNYCPSNPQHRPTCPHGVEEIWIHNPNFQHAIAVVTQRVPLQTTKYWAYQVQDLPNN